DRNLAAREWQHDRLAHELAETIVSWVNGNGRIAEHRFGSCSGDSYPLIAVLDWILEVIEFSGLRQLLDFEIGEHRLVLRAPVNDAVAAIDQTVLVATHKHVAHDARKVFVHRELLARPVDRVANAAHLYGDLSARLAFPLPNTFDKLLAPEIVTRLAFLLQRARDH